MYIASQLATYYKANYALIIKYLATDRDLYAWLKIPVNKVGTEQIKMNMNKTK